MKKRLRRIFGERGAAIVEMAIVLPLLVVLVFGIVEYGLLFREKLTIAAAANSAARTGATMGTLAEADIAILRALEAGLYDQVDAADLIRVDIFRADEDGVKTSDFNRYEYNVSVDCKWVPCPDPDPVSNPGGAVYGLPGNWPPDARKVTLSPGGGGLDVLGVEIVYRHSSVTKLIPGIDRNFTEMARIRLEPNVFGMTTATP